MRCKPQDVNADADADVNADVDVDEDVCAVWEERAGRWRRKYGREGRVHRAGGGS